ncbi:MAG: hypothetical protein J7647_32190 [Cyanobacteria bacterium SBLK]|nr:hypothetical protein [Cyanobacteria bacterium SBLK]
MKKGIFPNIRITRNNSNSVRCKIDGTTYVARMGDDCSNVGIVTIVSDGASAIAYSAYSGKVFKQSSRTRRLFHSRPRRKNFKQEQQKDPLHLSNHFFYVLSVTEKAKFVKRTISNSLKISTFPEQKTYHLTLNHQSKFDTGVSRGGASYVAVVEYPLLESEADTLVYLFSHKGVLIDFSGREFFDGYGSVPPTYDEQELIPFNPNIPYGTQEEISQIIEDRNYNDGLTARTYSLGSQLKIPFLPPDPEDAKN